MAVSATTHLSKSITSVSGQTTISSVDMGLKVSEQVLPKIFARIAYQKGYMVNNAYDVDAQNSLTVLIPKFGRPTGKFESIANGSNYDPFTTTPEGTFLDYATLNVDLEYRKPIKIAEAQIVQNVIGDKVVATMTDYVSRTVAEQINYITAEAFYSSIVDYEGDNFVLANAKKIVAIGAQDGSNVYASVPDAMANLIAKIGNADPAKGDTSFNDYKMSQVISNSLYAKLMTTKGQFILESSYGQEILIDGTLGRITLGDLTAYKGRILGVDTFVLPDAFFPSYGNTNFTENPTVGKVLGVMAVAESTERVFVDRGVKITDAVDFRGWVLQPLYRVGVTCLKPWGAGLIVSSDFKNGNEPVVAG